MTKRRYQWREGTFWDHLAAAADMVGFDNADIALGIARVPWETVQDRDRFLQALVAPRASDMYRGGSANGQLP